MRRRLATGWLSASLLPMCLVAAPAAAQVTGVNLDAVCSTTVGGGPVARFDVVPVELDAFSVPIGPDNAFSPGPADRGQPTDFHPAPTSIAIPFDPAVDPPLTWTLGGSQATAGGDLPPCPVEHEPLRVPLLDDVVPDDLRRSLLETYVAQGRLAEPFARGPRGPEGSRGDEGGPGAAGPGGSVGDPGISVVRARFDTSRLDAQDTSGSGAPLSATCPEGSIAVAGGADADGAAPEMAGSAAGPDGTSWAVQFTDPAPGVVDVYAVCLAATSSNVAAPPPAAPGPGDGDGGSEPVPGGGSEPLPADGSEPDPRDDRRGASGGTGSSGDAAGAAAVTGEPSRGSLVRTGASLALLTMLAGALLGAGTALRRVTRRRS